MSYTNGGQTIDKSMNGIISYDTGGGVVIEGDTITATNVITDNITCETLEVNTSATFNGTASFNTALPTSTITTATNNDEFITLGIGNSLYASGSILGSNNTWTGQNYYNTILPTSGLTGTPTATQIAPYSMLSSVLAPIASPTFTGTVTLPTTNMTGNLSCNTGNQINISGFSTNYIKNTGFDGATPTTCNVEVGLWQGLGFRDLISNITKIFFNARVGAINCVDLFVTTALYVNNININTIYGALTSGATNTWFSSNLFNSILPTSILTGTPNLTDIAPVSMLNALYGRLSTINEWSAINTFSAGIVAPIQTTIITWNSGLFSSLAEQTFDTVTGVMKSLIYSGTSQRYDFGFLPLAEVIVFRIQETVSTFFTRVQVTTPETANTNIPALNLTNSNTTPTAISMVLNMNGGLNGIVQAGDSLIMARSVFDSATTALVLAPWSSTTCGVRITKDDVTLRGLTNNFSATTTNITGATNFTSLPTMTTGITAVTAIDNLVTKRITDALYTVTGGYARLTTVQNDFTNDNTFVNLPTTTTTFTTATANQFITKNIGDALYLPAVTGGYARLTTVNNAFTNNNTFVNLPSTTTTFTSATTNQFITKNIGDTLYAPTSTSSVYAKLAAANTFTGTPNSFTGTTTELLGTNAIMGATNNIIRRTTDGNSTTASLSVRDRNATRQIVLNPASTVNHLNGIVEAGDAVICSAPSNQSPLTLTCSSTNNVGVRIDGSNNLMFINGGQTTIDNNVAGTTANAMLVLKNTAVTQSRISFHLDTNAVGMINPMVSTGENVIYSGDQSTGAGSKNLNLTIQSTTACGIKISRSTSNVLITGTSVTINPPITVGYTTAPTFTSAQIGYTVQSGQFTWNGATPNQVYQSANLITIPVLGVWKVDAYLRVYTATRPCRYTWSISPYNLLPTHDINRVTTDVYEFRADPSSIYMMTTYTKFHATGTLLAGTVDGDNNQFVPPVVPYTYGYYYVLTRLA